MNIHEYQAKDIFREYGIPVGTGKVVKTAEDAHKAALELSELSKVLVVKAQIHAGGRGKGRMIEDDSVRGVHVVFNTDDVREKASKMLGSTLVTQQTGPEGKVVNQVYIEAGCDIVKEFYLSALVDRENHCITFVVSAEGGMDIEEVAETHPEKVVKVTISPVEGVQGYHCRKIAQVLGVTDKAHFKDLSKVVAGMYKIIIEKDASQIEINPLIESDSGRIMALDAKVSFDTNGLYRNPDVAKLFDPTECDPNEVRANEIDLSYVKMDGNVGCMVNGAGLAMATMDIIKAYGAEPANFLDVGGSATEEKVTEAFKIILDDKNVKAVLVNIFGGIMKCDIIANGIIAAVKKIGISVPLVVRLEGTNVELGKKILNESGLAIISADDLEDAAAKVVKAF